MFFTWDPLTYTPIIKLYRHLASNVRTPDERPLTRRDLAIAQQFFPDVQHREFWIVTLLFIH
jgi:hypothetical protein